MIERYGKVIVTENRVEITGFSINSERPAIDVIMWVIERMNEQLATEKHRGGATNDEEKPNQ